MAEPAKAPGGEALPLRLTWLRTWSHREGDYTANAENYKGGVGRIYLQGSDPESQNWFWSMIADDPQISRNVGAVSGVEASARAAALKVEDAWFAAIKGSSLDRPALKRNSYRMAKAGE